MSRADTARKFLSERLNQFLGFKNMADARIAFFDSIINFQNTIIPGLRKLEIFEEQDISELNRLISDIGRYRNKGGNDSKVYHSTWQGFGEVQKKINWLIAYTQSVKVPWKYDAKYVLFSKGFLIPVICVFLAAIIQLILYLYIIRK